MAYSSVALLNVEKEKERRELAIIRFVVYYFNSWGIFILK